MEGNIIKIPGKYEELSIICPKCGCNKVTIKTDSRGFFKVSECHKCEYIDIE